MLIQLNHVHHQRLRAAVQAARAGAHVQFRVNRGEPCTLVWVTRAAPGVQHVIACIYGQQQEWIAAAKAHLDAELAGVIA